MILGIGNDLVDIKRIENSLKRFGKRFEDRIFTQAEQNYANRGKNHDIKIIASTYAKRFAAKEACSKAMGIGIKTISWRDIEVVKNASGAPSIELHGNAKIKLQQMTPQSTKAKIFLSLSDEYPYAQAQVIIEAVQ